MLALLLGGEPLLFLAAQGWYPWSVPSAYSRLHVIGGFLLLAVASATLAVLPFITLILVSGCLSIVAIVNQRVSNITSTSGEGAPKAAVPRGIYASPLTADLSDAVIQLMECLRSTLESRMLRRQQVREILYRVLRGEQGDALRALANRNDHFTQIARVLRHIHADFAQPLTTNELARLAGMSVSVFH